MVHLISDFLTVPSLYVRVYRYESYIHYLEERSLTIRGVYRWEENTVPGLRGSLTIREGISGERWLCVDGHMFPHYT